MKRYARWIFGFWREHLLFLPVLGLLTVLSTVVVLGMPLAWKWAVDTISRLVPGEGGGQLTPVHQVAGILLLVGLGRSLSNLYPMLRARMNGILEMAVRRTYFEKVLEKRHRFFHHFRTGDVVTRLTDDISGFPKIAWFMCSGIFRAVESASGLIFCVGAMLLLDWRLGLVAISPLPIMMILWYRVRIVLGKRFERNQRAISQTNDLLESCYSGIRILKAYNAEERFRQRFGEFLGERIEIEMGVVRLWAFLDGLYMGMAHLGKAMTILFGGLWILDGSLTLGTWFAIHLWVDQLLRPMTDIPQFFIAGKQTAVCIDRLEEIGDFEADRTAGRWGDGALEGIDRVELTGIGFRYGDDGARPALRGVDLAVSPGRKIAVVGPVGSGKSTLARVLAGELHPTAGQVRVNGRPREELDCAGYRGRVGYIPQEALLFSDTVFENVAFGRQISGEQVRDALSVARMDGEVARFTKGLEEMLGQRGVRVSGGQRQRLAVARALAGDPDLLVMDDVTAALDAENEEELWDALLAGRPGLAAVIVTHRMATARRADEILVLSKGCVVDRGTHAELLERCDLYRRLAHEHAA